MTDTNVIKVSKRQKPVEEAEVAGIVYGHDIENTNLTADYNQLAKLISTAGTSQLINLDIDGDNTVEVMLKDVQYHPVTNNISHFDFYAIKRGQKIKAEIPFTIEGESEAERMGANITQILISVEVECIPSKLPEQLVVDISKLVEIGDVVLIGDIQRDDEVEFMTDDEQVVAKAEEIRELVVEDENPEPDTESEQGDEESEGEDGAEGEESTDGEASKEATPEDK